MTDNINHPKHYTDGKFKCSKCGEVIECIDIVGKMCFTLGCAVKYIWRCDLKNDAIEDLKKAEWYIRKEIELREKERGDK